MRGAKVLRCQGAEVLVLGAMVLGATVLSTVDTFAQGRIDNARTETRTITHGLEQEVAAVAARAEASWIAYHAPMVSGARHICCYENGRCRLEGGGVSMSMDGVNSLRGSRVMLEPPTEFLVFVRVANGQIGRVRTITPDCDIDAGGMPVVWLEGVAPADSVAWLSTLVVSGGSVTGTERYDRVAKPAVGAIALHDVPDADRALESFMASTRPEELREDTTFWLRSARGENGVRLLIATATSDGNAEVRGKALFWLAQKAGQQAMAAITNAITNDPDTDVKKKAVFALSQMSKDEGVPRLIEVARTNRNPEVRKQAMFWLGQSKDPRAVQFFTEILAQK